MGRGFLRALPVYTFIYCERRNHFGDTCKPGKQPGRNGAQTGARPPKPGRERHRRPGHAGRIDQTQSDENDRKPMTRTAWNIASWFVADRVPNFFPRVRLNGSQLSCSRAHHRSTGPASAAYRRSQKSERAPRVSPQAQRGIGAPLARVRGSSRGASPSTEEVARPTLRLRSGHPSTSLRVAS